MLKAYRASVLHFLDSPQRAGDNAHQYFADGLLLVEDDRVVQLGDAAALLPTLSDSVEVIHYPNALIAPGFVDTHIHYPQMEMIAAYGEQLLEWLNTYTFPTETKFVDKAYARDMADTFLDELLRAGTTTALVFGTVHKQSVEAFFEASHARNLRMICGKVLMDRNAPEELTDTAEDGYQDSRALIEQWHNHGRQRYAVTPRFAPTSSSEQLRKAGDLLQQFPDVYMHTHLSENTNEVAWVKQLFPECKHYLDSYDQAGLLGRRSVFAHCLHLEDDEWNRLSESRSNIAFCPTSNLFLGSGLFDLERAQREQIEVGLGTDVGAGTSFSILQTLNEAYKVQQMRGNKLSPFENFYMATLGGARALDMDDLIGNFEAGKEADFVVLDKACTPLLEFRMKQCQNLFETLYVFAMLGDDRAIKATYAAGQRVHTRDKQPD